MDISLIRGELALAGAAVVLLLTTRLTRQSCASALVALAAAAAAPFLSLSAFAAGGPRLGFGGTLASDPCSNFFTLLFCGNLAAAVLLSRRHAAADDVPLPEYHALLLLATAGAMLASRAADLMTLYLGLELMAMSTYVLVGITRHEPRSNEAALKYFLLGGCASAVLLYGASLTYGLTGSTGLAGIAAEVARRGTSDPALLMAVGLLAAGLGFKIAAAPFHVWAPDAYEGAPTAVTAFMSVGTKAAGFAALARVSMTAFGALRSEWTIVLAALAVLSMGIGNVTAIAQTNVKRMLAYSSIAHAGYALLGLVAGTPEGASATMSYLLLYALMTLGAFSVLILLRREGVRGESLSDFEGLASSHPLVSAAMLVFMFSLTGIPPTGGFIAKFGVFRSVIREGHAWLALIAVIFSVFSAFFYLRIVMLMYMKEPRADAPLRLAPSAGAVLAVAAAVLLALGVFPQPLLSLAAW